jgi:ABC-type lipoprotein release transport system permease subunit
VVRGFLPTVSLLDPLTYGAVAVALAAVAFFAAWLPVHRAARADPLQALRAE